MEAEEEVAKKVENKAVEVEVEMKEVIEVESLSHVLLCPSLPLPLPSLSHSHSHISLLSLLTSPYSLYFSSFPSLSFSYASSLFPHLSSSSSLLSILLPLPLPLAPSPYIFISLSIFLHLFLPPSPSSSPSHSFFSTPFSLSLYQLHFITIH